MIPEQEDRSLGKGHLNLSYSLINPIVYIYPFTSVLFCAYLSLRPDMVAHASTGAARPRQKHLLKRSGALDG